MKWGHCWYTGFRTTSREGSKPGHLPRKSYSRAAKAKLLNNSIYNKKRLNYEMALILYFALGKKICEI